MADGFPYPLWVVGEWDSGIPKLKNKLNIYFQSKKSEGGDCFVEYESSDGQRAVVRFSTEEVRQRVLQKQDHQLKVDHHVLKLTVTLPLQDQKSIVNEKAPSENSEKPSSLSQFQELSDKAVSGEKEEEKEEEGPLETTSVVLENIQEKMSREFLEMLVENISDCSAESEDFSLEIIYDLNIAVVSYKNVKGAHDFITKCSLNRMFKQSKLAGKPLEITRRVKVEDIPPNITTEHLQLYFEREGDVEDITELDDGQSAIVTFMDAKVAEKVQQEKYYIKKIPLRVYPYYESLGTALYGKDRPVWKLPDSFTESLNSSICTFLHNKGMVGDISREMANHFCMVDLQDPIVTISPMPSLLKQKGLTAKHIDDWRENASEAFCQAIANIKFFEYPVSTPVWRESEMEISTALAEAVSLVPDMTKGMVTIAGFPEDVNRLQEVVIGVVDRVTKKTERERNSISLEVSVAPSVYHILQAGGLQQKVKSEYPELKLIYSHKDKKLTLWGLTSEVYSVKSTILEGMVNMKQKKIEMNEDVLAFLSGVDPEEFTHHLLTSQGITASYGLEGGGVLIFGNTDSSLNEAENQLKNVLGCQIIDVEDLNVLRKPEWQDLVVDLKKTFNTQKSLTIKKAGPDTNPKIVVTGFQDQVKIVWEQLSEFLSQYSVTNKVLDVNEKAIVTFIQNYKREIWSAEVKDNVKVDFNDKPRKPNISLSGPRIHVKVAEKVFVDMLSSVHFDILKVTQPWARKYFQDKLVSQMRCVIQLLNEDSSSLEKEDDEPLFQVKMPDGVAIAVSRADICNYPVDVVVNASNEQLQHIGGLAAAVLTAAGPQLQHECDMYIRENGDLSPGDAVITSAGHLSCKHIIHAVGPRFENMDRQRAVGLLKRVVKQSLKLAEKHNCPSIAIPAISSGIFGFPLGLCVETIALAVKEHCEDLFGENSLRSIHLVDQNDKTAHAMKAAVKKVFGDHSTEPKTSQTDYVGTQKKSRKAESRPGLDIFQTKEGLTISLMKGYIEDASTKVIVNTIAEDLSLNSGAVSKAILKAAGPELQNLVLQEAGGTITGRGAVIVTEGCNLRSELVFHVIAPHWDKGKGAAEKELRGIIRQCLEQAELRLQESMAISAIGTGNLGFPKDLVASAILEEVLHFSSKKSLVQLQEVVFVLHPNDAPTIQAFTDVFNNHFRGSSTSEQEPFGNPAGLYTKVTSTKLGVHEMSIGSVLVQLSTGDITKETTDVIVNSSNSDFTLKSGVSKAILDAAGQAVEVECKQLGALPNTGMILTQPGNLGSKKIIHIVGQTDPSKIRNSVKAVLQLCTQNNLSSVSFPALGTGQGRVHPSQVADAMLDAVVDIVGQKPSPSIQVVKIVIFQPQMVTEFHNSMQKRESKAPQKKETFTAKFKSLSASFFGKGGVKEEKQNPKVFDIENEKVDPAIFHICGDSHESVENAKKWIQDEIIKNLYFKPITDEMILKFSHQEQKKIQDLQRRLQVSVRLDKASKNSLIVEGLCKDVFETFSEIQDMINNIRTETTMERDAKLLSNLVEWQYQQGSQYLPFDMLTNLKLEQAFNGQGDGTFSFQNQSYKMNPPNGPALDNHGNQLQIQRINKLEAKEQDSLPKNWGPMAGNKQCLMISLKLGTQEYNEVLGLFQATCKRNVVKIERVQNPSLWKNFQILRQSMEERNGYANNERKLFHGTSQNTIHHINLRGFNRSYAGKNAAAFGNGTYFAVNANYSASNTYSVPDTLGQKYMYLCKVLTGDFTVGKQGINVPPGKNNSLVELYDSVTDNPTHPSMFIIFNDIQAYPEYLITFK